MATNQQQLQIDIPPRLFTDVSFPLCLRLPAQQEVSQLKASVKVGLNLRASFQLHKGRGCFHIKASKGQMGEGLTIVSATAGYWTGYEVVNVVSQPKLRVISQSVIENETWKEGETILLSKDLRVNGQLDILAGVTVLLQQNVKLIISGTLAVLGTEEKPIVFTSDGQDSWGQLSVEDGIAYLSHTWFLRGGNSATKTSHLGHSESAPVIHISNGYLSMFGGGVTFNEGKAFGTVKSRIHLFRVTITHCDTGGEYFSSRVVMQNSHVFEIPDGDLRIDDDDNDGFYLHAGYETPSQWPYSSIEASVISVTEDDCVDHNGGLLEIKNTWLDSAYHEGVASSRQNRITINNTVAIRCENGFEVGHGAETLSLEISHSLATQNKIGIRYGDEYKVKHKSTKYDGTLWVSHSISVNNSQHDYFDLVKTNNRQNFTCSSMGHFPAPKETCNDQLIGPNLDHLHSSLNLFLDETCPSDVFSGRKLGEGWMKEVFLGRWNSQDVVFFKRKPKWADLWTKRRVLAMMSLKHPNLVSTLGYCLHEGELVVISEVAKPLFTEVDGVGPFLANMNFTQRLNLAFGIAKGLAYLHYETPLGSIRHGDLLPRNILATSNGEAKLNDFTDQVFLADRITLRKPGELVRGNETTCCHHNRKCGQSCPVWKEAPECRKCQDFTEKHEVYNLGMIFSALITDSAPSRNQYLKDLASTKCPLPTFCELTRSCLSEAQDRPTSWQVVEKLSKIIEQSA